MKLHRSRPALFALACGLLLAPATSSQAQEINGTVRGTVTDPTGALVPGATVVVVDTGKNLEVRRLTTNSKGEYVAPLLPVGTYEIDVEGPGFKRIEQKNVIVNVSDRLERNFTLTPGEKTQVVDVTGQELQVQLLNATAESLISGVQVRALPTNNRNYEQLVAISPGVSSNTNDSLFVGVYNYKNQTNVASFSISGGRDTQNNWTIDGADNVDRGSNRTLLNYPSVDAIEEFKLLRGSYEAEYGRGAAGQVEVVTRSGGSAFHGGVYEFFRNDALDANYALNKPAGVGRTPLRYNDFGGTIGGPLAIPGLMKSADARTHFFFSEEIRRIKTPTPLNAQVPFQSLLSGNFPYAVCSKTNVGTGACTATSTTVAPSPQAAAYIKDIFAKLGVPTAVGNTTLITSPTATFNSQEEFYRLDHSFSDRVQIMGRFLNDHIPTVEPGGLFTGSNLAGVSQTKTNAPGKGWLGRITFAIRPTLYNEAGYAYSYGALVSQPVGLDNSALSPDVGSSIALPFKSSLPRIPDLDFGGDFDGITGFGPYLDYNRNHNVFDNLTYIRGTHSLKFGFSFNHYNKNENSAGNTASPNNGSFSFGEEGTPLDANGNCINGSDGNCGVYQTWANFLQGVPNAFTQQSTDLTAHIFENTWEFFAQDSWRARRNLTFSYGLRYSLFLPPTDGGGILTNFAPSTFSKANAAVLDSGGLLTGAGNQLNGIILGGKGSPYGNGVNSRTYGALAPRIGIAYDPFGLGKTSIRGGFGLFQEPLIAGLWEASVYQNPPYNQTANYTATSFANPATGSLASNPNPPGLVGFAEKWKPSYTEQWSFDIQNELRPNLIAVVGYYGQHGVNLVGQRDINEVPPGLAYLNNSTKITFGNTAARLNALRPYPGWGAISIFTPSYASNYNGLQTSITKRFDDGSTLNANYTWSHSLTNNQTAYGTQTFDTYHPERDYGPTQLDRRHIFNFSGVYNLPFFRDNRSFLGEALGGWQFSSILAINTGLPLSVFQSGSRGDVAGLGILDSSGLGSTARPNLVGNPNASAPHTFNKWFNTSAFATNTVLGTDGTAGRGSVRGPGFWKLDTAFEKTFRITKSTGFNFRAAAYNTTNSVSYQGIRTTLTSSTFGKVTTVRDARVLQLAARLTF